MRMKQHSVLWHLLSVNFKFQFFHVMWSIFYIEKILPTIQLQQKHNFARLVWLFLIARLAILVISGLCQFYNLTIKLTLLQCHKLWHFHEILLLIDFTQSCELVTSRLTIFFVDNTPLVFQTIRKTIHPVYIQQFCLPYNQQHVSMNMAIIMSVNIK